MLVRSAIARAMWLGAGAMRGVGAERDCAGDAGAMRGVGSERDDAGDVVGSASDGRCWVGALWRLRGRCGSERE